MKKAQILILLLILAMFIVGCSNIKWVSIDEESGKEILDSDLEEEAKDIVDSILEDIGIDKEDAASEPSSGTKEDRVDVELGLDTGSVSGTIDGITQSFTTPYDDKEAIMFDIAKEWGKKVKEVRHMVYFNGKPYSIKALEYVAEEEAQEVEKNITNFNLSTIPWIKEYDSGIVLGIGCSLEKQLLRLKLTNDMTKDLPMYRNTLPRIKGALVVYLNNKVIELHCTDSLAPEETVECIKSNIGTFVAAKGGSIVNEDAEFDLVDIVAISIPGRHEQFVFQCLPSSS